MSTNEEAKLWIINGGACFYRYGLAWKGAQKYPITKERALELLPDYSFGMGYYELKFTGTELIFNEYSEGDMF
jgi:hypothetical protein